MPPPRFLVARGVSTRVLGGWILSMFRDHVYDLKTVDWPETIGFHKIQIALLIVHYWSQMLTIFNGNRWLKCLFSLYIMKIIVYKIRIVHTDEFDYDKICKYEAFCFFTFIRYGLGIWVLLKVHTIYFYWRPDIFVSTLLVALLTFGRNLLRFNKIMSYLTLIHTYLLLSVQTQNSSRWH